MRASDAVRCTNCRRLQARVDALEAELAALKQVVAQLGQQLAASPFAELYPDADWERIMRKSAAMNLVDYDWSEKIKAMTAPVLLVFADADAIRPEHMVAFWKLLGGGQRDAGLDGSQRPPSQLAILPGTTHYSLIDSPLLPEVATAFLMQ